MIQKNFLIESISEEYLKKNILKSNFVLNYIDHIKPLSYSLNIPNKKDIYINYPIILEYFDKPQFNGFNFFYAYIKNYSKMGFIRIYYCNRYRYYYE